jgi:predicted nucleic acid-binding protein
MSLRVTHPDPILREVVIQVDKDPVTVIASVDVLGERRIFVKKYARSLALIQNIITAVQDKVAPAVCAPEAEVVED